MHSEHAIECRIINCEKTDKIRISVLQTSLEKRERLRENFNKKWIWEEETKQDSLNRQLLYTVSITFDKIHWISLLLLLLPQTISMKKKTIHCWTATAYKWHFLFRKKSNSFIRKYPWINGFFESTYWKHYDFVVNKYVNSLENIFVWHWLYALNCLCIWYIWTKKKLSKMAVKNINNASWYEPTNK